MPQTDAKTMCSLHLLHYQTFTSPGDRDREHRQGAERGHAACLGQVSETLNGEGRLVS